MQGVGLLGARCELRCLQGAGELNHLRTEACPLLLAGLRLARAGVDGTALHFDCRFQLRAGLRPDSLDSQISLHQSEHQEAGHPVLHQK